MLRVGQRVMRIRGDLTEAESCGIVIEVTDHCSSFDGKPMVLVKVGDEQVLFSQKFLEPVEERREEW